MRCNRVPRARTVSVDFVNFGALGAGQSELRTVFLAKLLKLGGVIVREFAVGLAAVISSLSAFIWAVRRKP